MDNLDSVIRNAIPGGNVAKPLLMALFGLFASGVLFKSGASAAQNSVPSQDPAAGLPQTQPDEALGGLLGGLGGLLDKLQKGGLGGMTSSWVGSGQNQPVSPGQLGSAL